VPELPEAETIVRDLAPRLAGRTLRRPKILKPDVLRSVSPRRLERALSGARVAGLARRAKHLVLLLTGGNRVVFRLGMTGALLVYDRALSAEQKRYAVLRATLDDGGILVFRDVRRLGGIYLLDEAGWRSYTGRIGWEPLDPGFDLATFRSLLRKSTQAVKKVLMDQRKLAGVGNIYANEALFLAGIDPSRPASRVDPAEAERLLGAVRGVLRAAIENRGTTVRDYRTGTGRMGSHQFALHVYGREGEPCVRCGTPLAGTHAIDGRATTFCWRCQGATPVSGSGRGP
jgi:formamidopyrimidine-DNA glycosylase